MKYVEESEDSFNDTYDSHDVSVEELSFLCGDDEKLGFQAAIVADREEIGGIRKCR